MSDPSALSKLVLTLAVTLIAFTSCSTVIPGSSGSPEAAPMRQVELSDRYPSTTASDWVTYADLVAVVKVDSELASDPSPEDLARGEGDVERTVELAVQDVLWRSADSPKAPDRFAYQALGWSFSDGDVDQRVAYVSDGQPRLVVGQVYVIAFHWQPRLCYQGDGVIPGHWNGLGSGSELPYEGEQVGVGEVAGEQRSLAQAKSAASSLTKGSVAGATVGQTAAAVADLLADAQPEQPKDYGPLPSDC